MGRSALQAVAILAERGWLPSISATLSNRIVEARSTGGLTRRPRHSLRRPPSTASFAGACLSAHLLLRGRPAAGTATGPPVEGLLASLTSGSVREAEQAKHAPREAAASFGLGGRRRSSRRRPARPALQPERVALRRCGGRSDRVRVGRHRGGAVFASAVLIGILRESRSGCGERRARIKGTVIRIGYSSCFL